MQACLPSSTICKTTSVVLTRTLNLCHLCRRSLMTFALTSIRSSANFPLSLSGLSAAVPTAPPGPIQIGISSVLRRRTCSAPSAQTTPFGNPASICSSSPMATDSSARGRGAAPAMTSSADGSNRPLIRPLRVWLELEAQFRNTRVLLRRQRA